MTVVARLSPCSLQAAPPTRKVVRIGRQEWCSCPFSRIHPMQLPLTLQCKRGLADRCQTLRGNVGEVDADTSLGMRGWNHRAPRFDEHTAHPECEGLPTDGNRSSWPDAKTELFSLLQSGVDLAAPGCLHSFTASRLNSSVKLLRVLVMPSPEHIMSLDVSGKLEETHSDG